MHTFKSIYQNQSFKSFISSHIIIDYAVAIFHDALKTGKHQCYLRPDCLLPMMYIDDCLRSLHDIMVAPEENLSCRYCFQRLSIKYLIQLIPLPF